MKIKKVVKHKWISKARFEKDLPIDVCLFCGAEKRKISSRNSLREFRISKYHEWTVVERFYPSCFNPNQTSLTSALLSIEIPEYLEGDDGEKMVSEIGHVIEEKQASILNAAAANAVPALCSGEGNFLGGAVDTESVQDRPSLCWGNIRARADNESGSWRYDGSEGTVACIGEGPIVDKERELALESFYSPIGEVELIIDPNSEWLSAERNYEATIIGQIGRAPYERALRGSLEALQKALLETAKRTMLQGQGKILVVDSETKLPVFNILWMAGTGGYRVYASLNAKTPDTVVENDISVKIELRQLSDLQQNYISNVLNMFPGSTVVRVEKI